MTEKMDLCNTPACLDSCQPNLRFSSPCPHIMPAAAPRLAPSLVANFSGLGQKLFFEGGIFGSTEMQAASIFFLFLFLLLLLPALSQCGQEIWPGALSRLMSEGKGVSERWLDPVMFDHQSMMIQGPGVQVPSLRGFGPRVDGLRHGYNFGGGGIYSPPPPKLFIIARRLPPPRVSAHILIICANFGVC